MISPILAFLGCLWLIGLAPLDSRAADRIREPSLQERLRVRSQIVARAQWQLKSGYEEEGANDPADLVDGRVLKSLEDMDRAGLWQSQLEEAPWSDDYWAIYAGGLGARYADPEWPESYDWKEFNDYVQAHPLNAVLARGKSEELRQLSPAEKYGVWIGDSADTMTRRLWDEGRQYYRESGKVEPWMGICHGWAPAAFMEKRPLQKVTVRAADGQTSLEFFPADIRALASLIWAKSYAETRFIGRRCEDEEPARDADGRVTDPACRDLNAGAWHLSIVNQLGRARRSLVLDATAEREVWNQPILSYRYQYFRPGGRRAVSSLADAKVALRDWRDDPYRKFRSRGTTHLVGIEMELTYGVESRPLQLEDERSVQPETRTVQYRYDLELNAAGEILGGEWHSNVHPDFLWVPALGAAPLTVGDLWLDSHPEAGNWDPFHALTPPWMKAAVESARRTQPLLRLVRGLIEQSRRN
jgi:hypothetical protein